MASIETTPQMLVGIEEIDTQHQELIAIYNALDAAMTIGRGQKEMKDLLDRLVAYTGFHFQAEEKLMETHGFPTLETHQIEHLQLVDKVGRFQRKFDLGLERVSRPVMEFLKFWLTNHISQSDVEFGNFVRAQAESGIEPPPPRSSAH